MHRTLTHSAYTYSLNFVCNVILYAWTCQINEMNRLLGNLIFSKAQHTLPEDGPIGPKTVGANKEIF